MKKILILLIMFFSLGLFIRVNAQTVDFEPDRKIDGGLMLREEKSSPEYLEQTKEIIYENSLEVDFSMNASSVNEENNSNFTFNGVSKYFLGYNAEFILFTQRSVGENVEIWVANDLSYGYDTPADVVTQTQVDMLRDEFENNIYPTVTGFFGDEDYHDGTNSLLEAWGYVPEGYYSNSEGKKIVLVENIKDESYYEDVPFYVAGFYWGALEQYIDLNIVTIDTYAWFALMPNDNPRWQAYQYDVFGTLAHEFQHLIHADNDPLEEKWINEGMSDFSQYLCGYGHNWGHVEWFLNYPENSLLIWGDYDGTEILADYGQAYLLQLYISEQFGQEFTRALATSPYQGIDSVNRVLADFKTGIDFNELFRRFSIAVAIDDINISGGIYGFESLDCQVNYESAQASEKFGVPAWGANYKVIEESDKIRDIKFNGLDFLPSWQVYDNEYLWSGYGNGLDKFLIFEADLSSVPSATLEFDHIYYIEENWDFGFVQVSLDSGNTWISLANDNTVSDFLNWDEYPQIGDQLPGFTGYCDYRHEQFDLTPFVGQKVLVAFRYMTDGAAYEAGWLIDNVSIPEINYYNDCSSLEGYTDLNRLFNNYIDYSVTFINEKELPNGKVVHKIVSVDLFNVTDEDALELRQLLKDGKNYMVVWYASENDLSYVPFEYEIITK